MGRKSVDYIRLLTQALCLITLTFVFCTGFTLPSPKDLRKDIKKELAKIREKSPGAKQLALWRQRYEEAVDAIKQAERQSAQRYAPDTWEDALNMLSKAKEYARQKSYLKAEFLARKAAEAGNKAREASEKARADAISASRKTIERLKKEIDRLKDKVTSGRPELSRQIDELTIRLMDLVHAMKLDQFKDVEEGAQTLDKDIKKLSKRLSKQ